MAWPKWATPAIFSAGTGIAVALVTWGTGIFNGRSAFERNIAIEIMKNPSQLASIQEALKFLCKAGVVDDDRLRNPQARNFCAAAEMPPPK